MKQGRLLLLGVIALMGVVLVWQWVSLPERVPVKMGFGGVVERWGSKTEHLLTMTGATVLIGALFLLMTPLLLKLPAAMVNIPHREYWLVPQRRPELARRIGDEMNVIGAATLLLVLAAGLQTGYAATRGHGFAYDWVVLAVYLAFTIGWAIRLATSSRYRPPPGWRPGSDAPGSPGGGRL